MKKLYADAYIIEYLQNQQILVMSQKRGQY